MDRVVQVARSIAEIAVASMESAPGPVVMRQVTDALVAAVDADNVLFHEFQPGGYSRIHGIAPAVAWDWLPLHGAPTAELARLHPVVDHLVQHPEQPAPLALTDLMSERQWRSTQMVSLLRPVFGRSTKLHISIYGRTRAAWGWAATRDGRDYTRTDREVAAALRPLLDRVARHYLQARSLEPAASDPYGLTQRERVVLSAAADGLTAAAAGRRLGISERTVAKHLEHAYRKLDVSDRVSAVRVARDAGLLTAPMTNLDTQRHQPGAQLF